MLLCTTHRCGTVPGFASQVHSRALDYRRSYASRPRQVVVLRTNAASVSKKGSHGGGLAGVGDKGKGKRKRSASVEVPLAAEATRSPLPAVAPAASSTSLVGSTALIPAECDGLDDCMATFGEEGQEQRVMCCDYGFRSGAMRVWGEEGARVPSSIVSLAITNFKKEWRALRESVRNDEFHVIGEARSQSPRHGNLLHGAATMLGDKIVRSLGSADKGLQDKGLLPPLEGDVAAAADARAARVSAACIDIRSKLEQLTLNDAAVIAREKKRPPVQAAWPIRLAFNALCWLLDAVYEGRPIQRFWVLETVARIPYFSYISMLHLYESLGWWRAAARLRGVHFAEEWNELHHLMIMESLGGDRLWIDRFLAQHAAFFYYWLCVGLFAASPAAAYSFGELVEAHAADTYTQFFEENEELLRQLPSPLVAVQYYKGQDLYLFDAFQTAGPPDTRPLGPRGGAGVTGYGANGYDSGGSVNGGSSSAGSNGSGAGYSSSSNGSRGEGGLGSVASGNGSSGSSTAADAIQAASCAQRAPRRPPCDSLYDVFVNIRDDEMEHIYTMQACQDPDHAINCAPK